MRFSLRSLLIAVALIGAFLGGRASVIPLLEQHNREKTALEKQLQSLAELRPVISRVQQDEADRRQRLETEIKDLQDRLYKVKTESEARFKGRLALPVNTERAMIGDGLAP